MHWGANTHAPGGSPPHALSNCIHVHMCTCPPTDAHTCNDHASWHTPEVKLAHNQGQVGTPRSQVGTHHRSSWHTPRVNLAHPNSQLDTPQGSSWHTPGVKLAHPKGYTIMLSIACMRASKRCSPHMLAKINAAHSKYACTKNVETSTIQG